MQIFGHETSVFDESDSQMIDLVATTSCVAAEVESLQLLKLVFGAGGNRFPQGRTHRDLRAHHNTQENHNSVVMVSIAEIESP